MNHLNYSSTGIEIVKSQSTMMGERKDGKNMALKTLWAEYRTTLA